MEAGNPDINLENNLEHVSDIIHNLDNDMIYWLNFVTISLNFFFTAFTAFTAMLVVCIIELTT